MRYLSLQDNKLTGTLPTSWSQMLSVSPLSCTSGRCIKLARIHQSKLLHCLQCPIPMFSALAYACQVPLFACAAVWIIACNSCSKSQSSWMLASRHVVTLRRIYKLVDIRLSIVAECCDMCTCSSQHCIALTQAMCTILQALNGMHMFVAPPACAA